MPDPIGTEILGSTIGDLIAHGLESLGKRLIEVVGHVGQQLGPDIAKQVWDNFSVDFFGLDSEDERRIEDAMKLIPALEAARMDARLADATVKQNWYRLCIMDEDVKAIAATLLRHAHMSDGDWTNHVAAMNYKREVAIGILDKFKSAAAKAGKAVLAAINRPNKALEETGLADSGRDIRDGAKSWFEKMKLP